jgi:hypothetical protein
LLVFMLGIVRDRRLMREARVNLAIRWFIGYALHETIWKAWRNPALLDNIMAGIFVDLIGVRNAGG